MEGQSRILRRIAVALIGMLAIFSVWVNVGAAISPGEVWSSAQAHRFVSFQRSLGGTPEVAIGATLPYWAPAGSLFVIGACEGLYVSTGFSYATVPGQQLQHQTWIPVEQAEGINQTLRITFSTGVDADTPPTTLLTFSSASLVVVPTGPNRIRFELRNAGEPSVSWPPARTASTSIRPGRSYRVSVMTDPHLNAMQMWGIGVGIQHYLGGSGPAVIHTSARGSGPVAVSTIAHRPPSMAICKHLIRGATDR
jgi:hypothetical protein